MLTPENQGRLLRAVIHRVEVDEPANKVSVFITDLGTGLPGTTSEPAQQEATP